MPLNTGRRKTFRSADFFRNECNFYSQVLTRMLDFQKSKHIAHDISFTEVPRCLAFYVDGEHDFLALEDLRPGGYASASRQHGFDLDHCKLLLRALGKYHALSLAIKDQDPEMFKEMRDALEVSVMFVCKIDSNETFLFNFCHRKLTMQTNSRRGIMILRRFRWQYR